jgi:hypothetical protein
VRAVAAALMSARRRRGGSWTPALMTGINGWWRSTDGVVLEDTDLVAEWQDLSGLDHHLSNGGGTTRPQFGVASIDGLPTIFFDGVNDELAADFPGPRPRTTILVARLQIWSLNDVMYDAFAANRAMLQCITSEPTMRAFGGAALSTPDMPINDWAVTLVVFNNVASGANVGRFQVNDPPPSVTGSTGTSTQPSGIRIGRRSTGNAARMDVAEAILLDGVIDPSDEVLLYAYLKARYPSLGLS